MAILDLERVRLLGVQWKVSGPLRFPPGNGHPSFPSVLFYGFRNFLSTGRLLQLPCFHSNWFMLVPFLNYCVIVHYINKSQLCYSLPRGGAAESFLHSGFKGSTDSLRAQLVLCECSKVPQSYLQEVEVQALGAIASPSLCRWVPHAHPS